MSTAVILVTTYLGYRHDHVQHGGRPRLVRDLARLLRAQGFEVTIAQKGSRDAEIELGGGIRVRKFQVPVRSWTDILFALRTRRLVEAADLCVYASCEDGYPFFARRSIGIQHGIWWDKPDGSPLKRAVTNRIHFARMAALCRKARRVICVDTNLINWLRLHGAAGHAAAAQCEYLPNYFDEDAFPPPPPELIEQRFRGRRLVFLRRFEEARGPLPFVGMCAVLKARGLDFQASMIGWGSQEAAVRARVAGLGLADRIEIGESRFDGVAEALRPAALSVVPTIYSEGSSLSAIESIGMGIPVVASDAGGLGNLIVPGFNGYLVKAQPAALAGAVMQALSSREHYLRLAANCLAMRRAFSLRHWRAQVLRILRETGLVADPPAGGAGSEPEREAVAADG